MSDTNHYFSRLSRFCLTLRDDAGQIDSDPGLLAFHYSRFVVEGLHTGGGDRQPFSGTGFYQALALLARTSGAFAFLALQQFVANMTLTGRIAANAPWPVVGVAFGQLRNPKNSVPRWNGEQVRGVIPWLTGSAVFPQVILGMLGPDASELYALVDATERPEFSCSPPMNLIACSGTSTVSVQINALTLGRDAFLKQEPAGTLARSDAGSVLYQTPLPAGAIQAALQWITDSALLEPALKTRTRQASDSLLQRIHQAFETGCTPEEGQKLRAETGDFSVRLARLAVMASGGSGLLQGHPAERLYREVLLYSLMAQTETILQQAFIEVFP